ncbi:MAG: 2,3-diphosphoglycerate-dependent phosphoglycerate mutase [Hydrogenophilales bacterium]
MKLILLRHGESQWNLENRFTGWTDVSLTNAGIEEAKFSGKIIKKEGIFISSIFTSLLQRAIQTAEIVSDILEFDKKDISFDWRLNERHYGSLQGLNKSQTASKYGERQVQIWRRSFDVSPPRLDFNDKRHPRFNKKFSNIDHILPSGESLKDVTIRLKPFWDQFLKKIKNNSGNHLIVAHSNSLRAIVKILDNLSNDEIIEVNIPTGVPLVYQFDANREIVSKEYLISEDDLKKKQDKIKSQGKAV